MKQQSREFAVGDGRVHLKNDLMGESLVADALVASTHADTEVAFVPHVAVIGLGGRSVFDRGIAAVGPLVDELVSIRKDRDIVVGVSGGARVRHVFQIALDLGLPTGALAQLVGASEEQNATMLQTLLAKHKGVKLVRDHFPDLPLYLANGTIPIVISVPPYHHWEPPSRTGRIPEHGSDLGLFMIAEALGTPTLIFVKDQDGLFDKDPAKHDDAQLIPEITAQELIDLDLPSLIVDRILVETLRNARFTKQIRIVNGLVPGNLTRALNGEDVGTLIKAGA